MQNFTNCLEQEKDVPTYQYQKKMFFSKLLKHVDTISSHISGSEVSNLSGHNCIYSYFEKFGMPLIFLTLNLCTAHSPIFQLFYADTFVDLGACYPI